MDQLYFLLFPATFFLLLAVERYLPNRAQPRPTTRWIVTGIVFFTFAGIINATLAPALGAALGGHTLFDLSRLGVVGGGVVGLLASTFLAYWLHRAYHRSNALWRAAHQLHHAGERVDVAGFAFTHPIELAFATTIAPVTSLALGVSPGAAMLAGYLSFALGLFEHLDMHTPQWLGRIVQRPEMHAIHHQRGVHAYNYGLPLWDMLFGTFRNPAAVTEPVGFWDGASRHVAALLVGRDMTSPP